MREDDLPIYCVSAAENEPRRVRMRRRMAELGLACRFLSAPLTAADVRGLVARTGRTEPARFGRARLSPMLAVEEGGVVTTHAGQVAFHRRCVEAQYDPGLYV